MTAVVSSSPYLWSTLALAATLAAVAAVTVGQVAVGWISISVPWGRRDVQLRDRSVRIAAPPRLTRGALVAAARGRTPPVESGERTEVLDEEDGLILNRSLTRSRWGMVHAVELVRVTEDRVSYLHLAGPLPGTTEEFRLEDIGGQTLLRYRGRIPISYWGVGRAVARALIVPKYERLLDLHIAALTSACEERAARQQQRESSTQQSIDDE